MIAHLTIAICAAAVFLLWLAVRTFQRERIALYLVIPLILGLAGSSWAVVHTMLGYPTRDLSELENGFIYIHHVGKDPIWLMAVATGAAAPRLYEVPASEVSKMGRKGMADAAEKGERGIPVTGTYSGGEWVFHEVDPPEQTPKPRG